MPQIFRKPSPAWALDRTDRRIVQLLQDDARRSNKEIAAACGIADSTLSSRLRRLEARGVIRGYHAVVDPTAVGVGLQAITAVRLHYHTREAIDAFWEHTSSLPEAIRVSHVTGRNDFLVHLAVVDMDHLQWITAQGLATWPEVAHLETSVVYDQRSKGPLPDLLADPDSP